MMKLLLVSALMVAAASAALPLPKPPSYVPTTTPPGSVIAILRSDSEIAPDGSSYQYLYETANGISAEESGSLISAPEPALAARGYYHFTSPEGLPVHVAYVADENGYQPSGDVLPTPHPVPLAILRSLDYIAAHPQPLDSAVPVKKYY